MNQPELSERPQKPRSGCLGLLGGLGFVALIVLGIPIFLWAIGGMLIVSDPLEEVDAIVLLSGGDSDRWAEAGDLYSQKIAPAIILTETDQTVGDSTVPYSRLVENNISAMGVPKDHITITQSISTSTYDEAHSVLELMQTLGYQSCVIVTDPYHTFRTRMIFRNVFRGSGVEVSVHSVQGHWYRSTTWWLSARGWDATVRELGKIGAFLLGVRD